MLTILIAYATTEGQTRKIAQKVALWVNGSGYESRVVDTSHLPLDLDLKDYDAFIVAGSIHVGKHQASLINFVKRSQVDLNKKPTALLSVSASASRRDEKSLAAVKKCTDEFCRETNLTPTAVITVGGAILYTQYNFIIKAVMKRISASEGGPIDTSRDHELTDWDALQKDIRSFLSASFPARDPSHALSY
jgi:menaquinone-dependent protoporphyrinogen oxidase